MPNPFFITRVLENVPDKKINRWVVGSFITLVVLFTVVRLIPFLTADAYERASQFVGVPLPRSATEIKYSDKGSFQGGDYFVAAKVPREGMVEVITKLQMTNRVDLMTLWPTALESDLPWWTVSRVNDTNTFFADRPKEYSKVVARYENGTFYFRRHVPKR